MKFATPKFGDICCTEEQVVRFPDGLAGRADCTRFVVVDDGASAPFQWLVCVDDPAFAVSVLDPTIVLSYDAPEPPAAPETTTFVVATQGDELVAWWLDLRHPIIIRHANRMGEQVTLDDNALPERFPVTLEPDSEGQ